MAKTKKPCSKCGQCKSLDEFHRDKYKKDGHVSRCKVCVAEYNRSPERSIALRTYAQSEIGRAVNRRASRRYAQTVKGQATKQRYARSDKRRAAQRRYDQSGKGRKRRQQTGHKYRKCHPEKVRARTAVNHAIVAGQLPHISRCECRDCGQQAHLYHHADYNKPLDVIPLCRACDRTRHDA